MPATVRRYLQGRELAPAKAEEALKGLAEEEGAPPLVRLDLAILNLELGRPRTAENWAREYVDLVPDDPEGHYVLGRSRKEMGNDHAAIAALERAVELEPGLAHPTVLLAELLRSTRSEEQARTLLLGALKLYPKNPLLVAGLGEDQAAKEEYKEAAASFKLASELRPAEVLYLIRQAEVLLKIAAYAEAEEAAKKAIALAPKSGRSHSTLGFAKEKQKDFEAALASYLEAAKLENDDPGHKVDAAFMYVVLRDLDKAESLLKEVLKADSKHFEANLTLGTVYYHRGKYREAKKYISVALRANKDSIDANLTMGYVLLAEGKAKDAINCFERAAKLDEFDPEPLRLIGRAELGLGKVQDALKSFGAAIDRAPKDAWSHFDMGKALEQNGEYDRAKDSYLKAIEYDPTLPHPHLYLAQILDEVDDKPKEALTHYKAYLELGGMDPQEQVKQRVKQLER